MMNTIMSEKEYQHFLMDRLVDAGYVVRQANTDYDEALAMDRELVFQFLEQTQPKSLATLQKIYKKDTEKMILETLNRELTKPKGGLLSVLKNGIVMNGVKLTLMYAKPATSFNPDLLRKYKENIFSVMEEVVISDHERIDLVIFINGLAVISFELKCNPAGQTYEDAIRQYKTSRDSKNRLFLFKAGCFVNFAMDLREVYMTTKLAGTSTFFLPFNQGSGTGIDAGAGNPVYDDGRLSVSYMWDDILQKDRLSELIHRFLFIERTERKEGRTGRIRIIERLIFPRYHQLDVIEKLLHDVYLHGSSRNYLIQHSAGSGKTNSISWLAHRLTSLHDETEKIIFDTVLIVTDRVVVDRQLQQAVQGIDHKSGLIRVMDEDCTSADLAEALQGNVKIIATTIQKFPYIVEAVQKLQDRTFAVIIDEAHSSTAGKDMAAVTMALGSGEASEKDGEDAIIDIIRRHGKQPNVSVFAFTATPKATTLQLFGTKNDAGQYEPFHVYSMKQAIEEGFILDVLQNYIEYKMFYQINKKIADDPAMKTDDAKRQIARFISLHDTTISQRVEIMVEHFRSAVMAQLGGRAKGMIVTSSRAEAVKYKLAIDDYVKHQGYDHIHAVVAFSGKVTLPHDETEYTEPSLNGFSYAKLPDQFNTNAYNLLIVANKYQTGFDQPKLCAMYVLKKLQGVAAVQTLSRLNRVALPYDKQTVVLDFMNTCDDMVESFAPYYKATILSASVNPDDIYELEAYLDEYGVLDEADIEAFADIYHRPDLSQEDKQRLIALIGKTIQALKKKYDLKERREFAANVKKFIRFYEFLLQGTCFTDVELHKKYEFLLYVSAELHIGRDTSINLEGKLEANRIIQKKIKETNKPHVVKTESVRYGSVRPVSITDIEKEKLSHIIEAINQAMGKEFDMDEATKAILQLKDRMLQSEDLKIRARSNREDEFALRMYKVADDIMSDAVDEHPEIYSLLLDYDDWKKQVLSGFVPELYQALRK